MNADSNLLDHFEIILTILINISYIEYGGNELVENSKFLKTLFLCLEKFSIEDENNMKYINNMLWILSNVAFDGKESLAKLI